MRFRKIAVALLACVALGALAANVARAGQWTIGTEENQSKAGTKLTGPEPVAVSKHPGSELAFHASIIGIPVTLTAENIRCWSGAACTIETSKAGTDQGEGNLEFTEVKVSIPKCSVPGNKLVTAKLTQKGLMDSAAGGTAVLDTFFAESPSETIIEIVFEGAECPIAGVIAPLKGTLCGEVTHTITPGTYTKSPTGTLFRVQTLLFGKAQQETGSIYPVICSLKIGAGVGQFTGAVDNELSGTNKAKPYGAD